MCNSRRFVVTPQSQSDVDLPSTAEFQRPEAVSAAKPVNRRTFGKLMVGAAAVAAAAALSPLPAAHAQPPGPQSAWRYCAKCEALFFDGFPNNKGRCAKGGAHEARQGLGYDYLLSHDVPPNASQQGEWRACGKCQSIFWNGFNDKGKCPAGGSHERSAASFDYILPYGIPAVASRQDAWRFCSKCYVLFYDGFPDKGGCAAGGGHAARKGLGYEYVLSYIGAAAPQQLPPQLDFDVSPIGFPTGVAVGGWSHLTIRSDGTYQYKGHFHDSGAVSYKAASGWMVRTPSGVAYTFAASGKMGGTLSSDGRDWDFDLKGVNNDIKSNWADIASSSRAECRSRVNVDIADIISTVKQAVEVVGEVIKVIQVVAAS